MDLDCAVFQFPGAIRIEELLARVWVLLAVITQNEAVSLGLPILGLVPDGDRLSFRVRLEADDEALGKWLAVLVSRLALVHLPSPRRLTEDSYTQQVDD